VETAWPIEMLRQIAAKKVLTLHFFDEIEVYLGYPLMLAEKLGLKLAVQKMLYFRCSGLTQKDLDEAATTVLQTKQDRDAESSFLCMQKKWQAALREKYPERCKEIGEAPYDDNVYQAQEDAGSDQVKIDAASELAEQNLQEKWEALTAWALVDMG